MWSLNTKIKLDFQLQEEIPTLFFGFSDHVVGKSDFFFYLNYIFIYLIEFINIKTQLLNIIKI